MHSIYQPGFSFKRAGINILGNSRILRTNFRNTVQLQEMAKKYRSTLSNFDSENSPEAFRPGPPPELFTGKDKTDLTELLLDRIDLFVRRLEYDPENICVLIPMNNDIGSMRENLRERGYDSENSKSGSFDTETKEKMTRNLIYVSITGAMDHLNVFCKEDTSSEPIIDFMRVFE